MFIKSCFVANVLFQRMIISTNENFDLHYDQHFHFYHIYIKMKRRMKLILGSILIRDILLTDELNQHRVCGTEKLSRPKEWCNYSTMPDFNGGLAIIPPLKVRAWVHNYIPQKITDVFTYACLTLWLFLLSKEVDRMSSNLLQCIQLWKVSNRDIKVQSLICSHQTFRAAISILIVDTLLSFCLLIYWNRLQ